MILFLNEKKKKEMWNCPYSTDFFARHAEDFDNKDTSSPAFSMLSEAALCYKITIIGGSMPEWSNGRLYNTCCVFGPDGKLKARHRKVSTSISLPFGYGNTTL